MRVREVRVKYVPSDVQAEVGERFSDAAAVARAFRSLYDEPVEVFRVAILTGKNCLLHFEDVSRGSLSTAIVHPREVFWSAIFHRAAAIICLHNHPSGDPTPSREDDEITQKLYQAGELLKIRMLDHIIVGAGDRYFSYADAGLIGGGK